MVGAHILKPWSVSVIASDNDTLPQQFPGAQSEYDVQIDPALQLFYPLGQFFIVNIDGGTGV